MINKLSVLLFLLTFSGFAQSTVKGKIIDQKTNEPLAFANIMIDEKHGTISDFDGKFELIIPQGKSSLKISYIGYDPKSVKLSPQKSFYTISLMPSTEQLGIVIIHGKYVNPAVKLMKMAIVKKKHNNYNLKFKKYAFTKYMKFLVGAHPEKIKQTFDSIYINGKLKGIDSSLYKFKKEFADKDMWLLENLMKVNVQNGQAKHKLIATRIAGLKNPLYEFLAKQASDINVYDDEYRFLFQKYLGPISRLSLKQYRYEINDTINIQNRPVIVVAYKNTKKPLISGKLYLDKESLAIARLTINAYKDFQLNGVYSFQYYPKNDVWFPVDVDIKVKKAEHKKGLNFGGGAIQIKDYSRDNDSVRHTNKKSSLDYTYGQYDLKYFDIVFNRLYPEKIRYNFEIDPKASGQTEDYWKKYLKRQHTQRELNTYKYIDSVFKKEGAEKQIHRYKRLVDGYYPLNNKLDLDLVNMFDYNRYEGFRLKIGGRTNENLSDKLSFDAYVAYGFRDKALKYHLGAGWKLFHPTQTYLKIAYTNDLNKTAAFNSMQSRNLFALPQHLADDKFYRRQGFEIGFEHLLSQKFKITGKILKSNITQCFGIPYHKGRIDFNHKDEVLVQLQTEWTPFAQYYLRPEGRTLLKDGYPKLYMSFEKNLPALQIDQTDFYRFDIQALFKKQYLNKDYTDLLIRIGYVSKNPGINHLFSPSSNNYTGSNPFYRFNLEKNFAFETMNDLEFTGNVLLTGFLQHTITGIKVSKRKTFDLRLLARAAWGLSYDSDKYSGIKTPDNVYIESGIEFKRLFANMGLGFYYRLGTYAYPETWDNLSVRLTLDPFKLFNMVDF